MNSGRIKERLFKNWHSCAVAFPGKCLQFSDNGLGFLTFVLLTLSYDGSVMYSPIVKGFCIVTFNYIR